MSRLVFSVLLVAALGGCGQNFNVLRVSLGSDTARTGDDLVAGISFPAKLGASRDPSAHTFEWYRNGVLQQRHTGRIVPASATSAGELWRVIVRAPSLGLAPAESTIQILNSSPTVLSVSLSPDELSTDDDLMGEADVADADGDAISLRWDWFVDGAKLQTGASAILPSAVFQKGQSVYAVVTPSDASGPGESLSSQPLTVLNTPPALEEAQVIPSEPTATSTLECMPGEATDADGDSLSYDYAWSVNGVVVSNAATLSGVARSSEVSCTLTPKDDESTGEPRSASVTVRNAAPSLQSVALATLSPKATDALTVQVEGATDPDGDAVTVSYAWYVDGTYSGDAASLPGQPRGSVIAVTVTPNDGQEDGLALTSEPATVVNSLPVIDAAAFEPSVVTTVGTLTATATANDADADPVTLTYEWTVNGALVGETGHALAGDAFSKGDLVQVTVTPSDAEGEGSAWSSAVVTVANSAPSSPKVSLTPAEPLAGDPLVCTVDEESVDLDDDTVAYGFAWELDGVLWEGAAETTELDGDTLPADVAANGEEWSCVVTPEDDEEEGAVAEATISMPAGAPESVDTFTAGGVTVHLMGAAAMPAEGAQVWYQNVCEEQGLQPVSCDPTVHGSPYDASAWNALVLPQTEFYCNVSHGVASRTGWSDLATFHRPLEDATGLFCMGYCQPEQVVQPVCGEVAAPVVELP